MLLEKAELLWLIPLARGCGLVGLVVEPGDGREHLPTCLGNGQQADAAGSSNSLPFSEHKYSARWTKVMGTAEWKASRTRRW